MLVLPLILLGLAVVLVQQDGAVTDAAFLASCGVVLASWALASAGTADARGVALVIATAAAPATLLALVDVGPPFTVHALVALLFSSEAMAQLAGQDLLGALSGGASSLAEAQFLVLGTGSTVGSLLRARGRGRGGPWSADGGEHAPGLQGPPKCLLWRAKRPGGGEELSTQVNRDARSESSRGRAPGGREKTGMGRLSIVVVNYNYAQFVRAAIDSALAVDWHDKEVVVLDDGSTDGSVEVIKSYGSRIRAFFGENVRQRRATNAAFACSTGDVIVFLDSDDVLPPDLAQRLVRVWRPSVSKVQFRMQRIDEQGSPVGSTFPDYSTVPGPEAIRSWATSTSAYPTPPGSGNAYARWFLEQIFPLPAEVGDASDSACLAAAPFLGDVLTLPEVVVGYRRHGGNDSYLLGEPSRFAREVARACARWRFALAVRNLPVGSRAHDKPLFASRELLQLRVAARRMTPAERPLPGDGILRLAFDAVRSPFQIGPESTPRRLAISVWCLATLIAPAGLARRLLTLRYGRQG